ncbi:MAG: hypothetical protein J7J98_03295 [candidate division Zixibacteria bacterium]|nr:hypothetical protein [candidate division Zixibacteria bacterium]
MTKKIIVTYAALFLFAFTFAFAFAMEARAEDPGPICCVYVPCASDPNYFDMQGHVDKGHCVFTYEEPCDIFGICPNDSL